MAFKTTKEFTESGPMRSTSNFDPESVDKVETHEQGSGTIIETVTSFDNPATGVYQATLSESNYEENIIYEADWTYTEGNVQHTQTVFLTFRTISSAAEELAKPPNILSSKALGGSIHDDS